MTTDIILPPNSKAIPLTQGKYAIVDEADYDWLMQWKWHSCSYGYAKRTVNLGCVDGKTRYKGIRMHRFITGAPDDMDTDHINGNKLDNRRCNLRVCTTSQNMRNQKPKVGRTSKFKGVSWGKSVNKWVVQIGLHGETKYLGCFPCEIEAAKAYNRAALQLHGNFSRLNII